MALAMAPLIFVDSVPLMAVVLLVGGLAIAPTMIAAMSMIEQGVPAGRLTEGMAILHTGIVAGVAPGASVAGFVVDHSGASAAYAVALVGGSARRACRPGGPSGPSLRHMSSAVHGHLWRNWSGLEEAVPRHVETPGSVASVVDAVRRAREGGTTVKMTGTGHSFTAIAAPEHTLLRPEALTGILAVDREAMTVTARAGTPLKDLNLALEHARPVAAQHG